MIARLLDPEMITGAGVAALAVVLRPRAGAPALTMRVARAQMSQFGATHADTRASRLPR